VTSVRKIGTNSEQSTHVFSDGFDLYEFIKTMEMYHKTIGKQSTLFLSTNSEIYKFLKSSDAAPLFGE